MLYAMADTHLSGGVEKPMDIFGSRWHNWTEAIERNWKNVVKEDDTVILPGDISWGINLTEAKNDLLFLESLPGKKILGRGNHDYWWNTISKIKNFFRENGIQSIELLHNNAFEVENKILVGSRGWFIDEKLAPKDIDYNKIVEREAGRLKLSIKDSEKYGDDKEKIAFFHFPPVFASFICRELVDVLHENNITRCFYGHIHGKYDIPQTVEFENITFTIISADYLNFKPYLVV